MAWNNKVLDLMNERNINQKQLSKLSGIHESSISRYLHSGQKPRIDVVVNIAKALQVDTGYLLDDITQKWIPCSERLPKEEGVYPVVINGTEPVLSVEYEQGFAMGHYAPIDEAWEIDGHEELIHDLEVLAWFKLPPYEENES